MIATAAPPGTPIECKKLALPATKPDNLSDNPAPPPHAGYFDK